MQKFQCWAVLCFFKNLWGQFQKISCNVFLAFFRNFLMLPKWQSSLRRFGQTLAINQIRKTNLVIFDDFKLFFSLSGKSNSKIHFIFLFLNFLTSPFGENWNFASKKKTGQDGWSSDGSTFQARVNQHRCNASLFFFCCLYIAKIAIYKNL